MINKDAQVLIMTTEILRNMLYQRYTKSFSSTFVFLIFYNTSSLKSTCQFN